METEPEIAAFFEKSAVACSHKRSLECLRRKHNVCGVCIVEQGKDPITISIFVFEGDRVVSRGMGCRFVLRIENKQ